MKISKHILALKRKVKKQNTDDTCIVSAPSTAVFILIAVLILAIFMEMGSMASVGFKARETANMIARQVSITGEINQDTAKIAEDFIRYGERINKNTEQSFWGYPFPVIISVGIDLDTSDHSGYDVQWTSMRATKEENFVREDLYLPAQEDYRAQLGTPIEVLINCTVPTRIIADFNFDNDQSYYVNITSHGVSQIYWKDLDTTP